MVPAPFDVVEHRHDALDRSLQQLIDTPELDVIARENAELIQAVTAPLVELSAEAWASAAQDEDRRVRWARLVSQRALYRLNRLRLYWGDDPSRYVNERSIVLLQLEAHLERPWQRWLADRTPSEGIGDGDPVRVLRAWAERDLTLLESNDRRWVSEQMNLSGYRRLLAIASLNGLVEASQLSRAVGGASSGVQGTLFRILIEEYGGGRPDKKHSKFFERMLAEQGMCTEPEAYFSEAPWEVLSAINHAFTLTEYKRNYLRFCGAFTYTELSTPVSFQGYAAAARRLGLSDGRADYWSLHVREDERHGAWMVEQVALPLLSSFPERTREVLFGYAQQRFVESMASAATVRACRIAAGDNNKP